MPRYRYEANDNAGDALQGVVTAPDVVAAVAQLESRGLNLRSVSLDRRQLGEAEAPLSAAVDRLMASRNELVEPLAAYAAEFATGRRRNELKGIVEQLNGGDHQAALAAAGSNPAAWSAVLAAAAESDEQGSQFARFVEREKPTTTLRWRRSLAMAYPLVIAALCLAIVWPLAMFVLPTFDSIFSDFGLQVPWATCVVLRTGRFLATGGAILLLCLMALATVVWLTLPIWAPTSLRRWLRNWGCVRRANRSLMRARLATHAANLVEAGLPPVASLPIVDDDAFPGHDAAGAITYAAGGDFQTTTRTRLLRALATNHGEASAATEQWAMGLAGPVTIVVLGVVVGTTVIGLFLPLVRLIEGLN